MGGVFYILMGVSGGLAGFARRGLIVSGDAAATATNIVAHPSAYLLGFSGELFVVACYVVVVALFYRMLEPVNGTVSLTAAYLGLMGCAVQASALVFYLAPLTVLGGAPPLGIFTVQELQALAFMFQKLYSQAYGIAIVFFGFYCLLTGYLAFKSAFLPRAIGALMMLAGLSWLAFLSPPFAARYFRFVLAGAVGEALFALWLVVKGVDAERWKQRADAARTPEPS
jgi:hypothetical protein